MKIRLSRRGLYQKLDTVRGTARDWLDEKRLLDAEFLAAEADAIIVTGGGEPECEDLEEYLERVYG